MAYFDIKRESLETEKNKISSSVGFCVTAYAMQIYGSGLFTDVVEYSTIVVQVIGPIISQSTSLLLTQGQRTLASV